MIKVSELAMGQEPEVGQVYLVPCLDLSKCTITNKKLYSTSFQSHLGKMVAIPILGKSHTDPEFPGSGGDTPHIHTDNRFITEFECEDIWEIEVNELQNGTYGSLPVIRYDDYSPSPQIFFHPKMCFRKLADFRRRVVTDYYSIFEDNMADKTINIDNPVCSHHGTSLKGQPIRDGIVTCPLHGASFCAKSGKFVRKTQPSHTEISRKFNAFSSIDLGPIKC